VAREAEGLVAIRLDNRTLVLVVRDNERNGDACIDQGCIFGNPHD
jgi:hypothetical protein